MAGFIEGYISTPMEDTYGKPCFEELGNKPKEIDSDLGLELVDEKPTIFQKYGVECDPSKNCFHESLFNQYEKRGSLTEKQVNALRKSY